METFLFTTAFKRPNGEILPGEVSQLEDGTFKFHAIDGSIVYYFIIKKDDQSNWYWVDGHTASLDRVSELGEKINSFFSSVN